MKKFLIPFILFLGPFLFAQQSAEESLANKVYEVKHQEEESLANKVFKVQHEEEEVIKEAALDKAEEEAAIRQAQKEIVLPAKTEAPAAEEQPAKPKQSNTANEVKKPERENKQEIKKEVKQNKDPEGVDWISLSKGKLNVKMQRRKNGVPTPNLSMRFNNVYQSLFRNIPWLMGGSANVYVYQNRQNFLSHEPVASDWSGAFFSPENNRIVMYDEPDNVNKMLSQFQHELTHLFVENYFCPPGSKKPEPPVWLNEGLAVNMEDITNKTNGDIWAHDLIVMNLLPSSKSPAANLKAPRPITDATVRFIKFSDFVKNDSYDSAVAAGKVDDWYMQAYAMVRFLFKPYNNQYPEKRIQFEQFTKLLNTYQNKKDSKGRLVKDENGRQVKARTPIAQALKQSYGYSSIDDFELKFWQWLYPYQREQREKLNS